MTKLDFPRCAPHDRCFVALALSVLITALAFDGRAQDVPRAGTLSAAADFNVFVLSDTDASTPSIQGAVATGRDLTANGFGYNTSSIRSTGLVVGRNLRVSSGSVYGNGFYGGTRLTTGVTFVGGALAQGTGSLDFAAEEIVLGLRSMYLATLPANGTTIVRPWVIEFHGSDPALNIFDIDSSSFDSSDGVIFSVPEGATVVVNASGSTANLRSMEIGLGTTAASRLLWNFHDAIQINLAQISFEGTLLAPNATVTHTSASFEGQLIAESLVGTNNGINWQPFTAPLPCVEELDCAAAAKCIPGYSSMGPRCLPETGPEECAEPSPWAPPTTTGAISYETWLAVPGRSLSAIPTQAQPTTIEERGALEAPREARDNYGVRMRGWLRAPSTGSYTFWIAGDDNVALYLSPDETPTHKSRIAYHSDYTQYREWNRFPSQRSLTMSLVAGNWYYIEAWMKDATGGDHLSVGWLRPGQVGTQPSEVISGQYLAPYQEVFPPPPAARAGTIAYEKWLGQSGRSTSNIPTVAPSNTIEERALFDAPRNALDDYGAAMRGWITPPATASYVFWVSGDDNVALYMSPNTNPANRMRIAYHDDYTQYKEWGKFASQRSAPIFLEQGNWYYVEALVKEASGDDHLSVAWRPALAPETQTPEIIHGQYLAPYREVFPPAPAGGIGGVSYDRWIDITGTQVSRIPLTLTPNVREQREEFEAARDVRDQYGARMRGWISPPSSGQYKFWVSGDDNVELYLSATERPNQKALIASHTNYNDYLEWFKYPGQASSAIELDDSKWYYIEALVKESTGHDHLSVGWAKVGVPGNAPASVIPRTYLAPFGCSTPNSCGETSGAGGTFVGCGPGSLCSNSADCWDDLDANGSNDLICHDGTCSLAQCFNGSQDGDEAGVDCGGDCRECGEGDTCTDDEDCGSDSGLVCIVDAGRYYGHALGLNACALPECEGHPGARICRREPVTCSSDGDCMAHERCSAAAAAALGVTDLPPGRRVCWHETCESPQAECGDTVFALCGRCACEPSCEHKHCGDDLSDGCGGRCPAACSSGEPNCQDSGDCIEEGAECIAGAARFFGAAEDQAACMPSACLAAIVGPELCGSTDSTCGLFCTEPAPEERTCGECSLTEVCWEGECVARVVEYPDVQPLRQRSLPKTAGIGTIEGRYDVTPQGRSTYTIPLRLPKGAGGLTPELSFDFVDGGAKRGIMGPGWSLGGLSKVHRCDTPESQSRLSTLPVRTQRALPDEFCLDGHALVLDEEMTQEEEGDVRVYRLANYDGSKVLKTSGGPAHDARQELWSEFAVHKPDGTVWTYRGMLFGQDPQGDILDAGIVESWYLYEVRDQFGNYSKYDYDYQYGLAAEHYVYLEAIAYSYTHAQTRRNLRQVRFHYKDKDDQLGREAGYSRQKRLGDDRLLDEVSISVFDLADFTDRVRYYRISYNPAPSSGLERVSSIEECITDLDQSEVCLPGTAFAYDDLADQDPKARFGAVQQDALNPVVADYSDSDDLAFRAFNFKTPDEQMVPAIPFDANGDGLKEIIQIHHRTGVPVVWFPEQADESLRYPKARVASSSAGIVLAPTCITSTGVGDIDRDGRDEFIDACGQAKYAVIFNMDQEGRFGPGDVLQDVPRFGPMYFADIDGDGMLDIVQETEDYVYFTPYSGRYLTYEISDGERAFSTTYRIDAVGKVSPKNHSGTLALAPLLIDVDGDGVSNLLRYDEESKQYVALSLKSYERLSPQERDTVGEQESEFDVRIAIGEWNTTGLYFEKPSLLGGISRFGNMRVLDINGDGLQDVWYQEASVVAPLSPAVGKFRIEPIQGSNVTVREPVDLGAYISMFNKLAAQAGFMGTEFEGPSILWVNKGGRFVAEPLFAATWSGGPVPEANCKKLGGDDHCLMAIAPWHFRGATVFDYDNDGMDELLFRNGPDWQVVNLDSETPDGVSVTVDSIPGLPGNASYYDQVSSRSGWADIAYPLWADLNGDAAVDFLVAGFGGDSAFVPGIGEGAGTRLTGVVDGLGNTIKVEQRRGRQIGSFGGECGSGLRTAVVPRCLASFGAAVTEVRKVAADAMDLGGNTFEYRNPRKLPFGRGSSFEGRVTESLSGEEAPDGELVRLGTTTDEFSELEPGLYPSFIYPFASNPTMRTTTLAAVDELHGNDLVARQHEVFERFTYDIDPAFDKPHLARKDTFTYQRSGERLSESAHVAERFWVGERGLGGSFDRSVYIAEVGVSELQVRTDYNEAGDFEARWGLDRPRRVSSKHTRNGETAEVVSEFTYYPATHAVFTRTDLPGDERTLVTTYEYDSAGNPIHIIASDSSGSARETIVDFGQRGLYPESITNAEEHTTQVYYDDLSGAPAVITDPNGFRSEVRYDRFGRVVYRKGVDGEFAIAFDEEESQPYSVDGARIARRYRSSLIPLDLTDGTRAPHARIREEFDSRGLRVRLEQPGLDATGDAPVLTSEVVYDWAGRVVRQSEPHTGEAAPEWTEATYDLRGRVIEMSSARGTRTFKHGRAMDSVWVDIAQGFTVTVSADEEGKETAAISDFEGELAATVEGIVLADQASGYVTTTTRGAFDRVVNIRDPDQLETSIQYTPDGLVKWVQDADRGVTSFEHSAFGETEVIVAADDEEVRQFFDRVGRKIRREDADGVTSWVYDRRDNDDEAKDIGLLVATSSPFGVITEYTYESAERRLPSTVTYAVEGRAPATIGYEFDAFGRLERTLYPEYAGTQFAVRSEYDPHSGQLIGVKSDDGATTLWSITAADDQGRPSEVSLGNGTQEGYQYDSTTRRLANSTVLDPTGVVISELNYRYYDNGQVFRRTLTHGDLERVRTMSYDRAKRLDRVDESGPNSRDESFDFSPAGRLTSRTKYGDYTPDDAHPHAIASVGDNSFHYDVLGNQRLREGPDVLGGRQTIAYNRLNLPSSITIGDEEDPAARVFEFKYDALGQRVLKREAPDNEVLSAGRLYERVTQREAVTHRYRVFAGTQEVLAVSREEGSDAEQYAYLHRDQLSSVLFTTNESGEASELRDLDVFGAPVAASHWENGERTQSFTGHDLDFELGLVNMGARLYDPIFGVFISPDPLLQSGLGSQGINPYAYANNDPVNYVDPTGLQSAPCDGSASSCPEENFTDAEQLETPAGTEPLTPPEASTVQQEPAPSLPEQSQQAMPPHIQGLLQNTPEGNPSTRGLLMQQYLYTDLMAATSVVSATPLIVLTAVTAGSEIALAMPALTLTEQTVIRAASGAGAVIQEGKIGYLLGQASGRAHNVERALQNAGQLARVGAHDTAAGRALLQSHLQGVAADALNIARTFSNQYGNFVVKESLFVGPGGFLKFESTWQAIEGGALRLTTVIPFGG